MLRKKRNILSIILSTLVFIIFPITSVYATMPNGKVDTTINNTSNIAVNPVGLSFPGENGIDYNLPDGTDLNGNPVNSTVEFGTDGQSVLVTPPVKGYNLSGTYYLYIKEGVKLQTGQPLQQAVRMGFVIKGAVSK
jgi:hypothetical protein